MARKVKLARTAAANSRGGAFKARAAFGRLIKKFSRNGRFVAVGAGNQTTWVYDLLMDLVAKVLSWFNRIARIRSEKTALLALARRIAYQLLLRSETDCDLDQLK